MESSHGIVVFAHVPPPHHGQSYMVKVMLEGLRADPRFVVHHVNAQLSDDLADVGGFHTRKILRLLKCVLLVWWIRLRHGPMAFYYVPAPAKKSAILRDWLVMALCRPLFPKLILHWHAYGLGEWVGSGDDWPRKVTRQLLGGANLSIVLNDYNKREAGEFAPKRIAVVPNGVADLFSDYHETLGNKRVVRAATLKTLVNQVGAVSHAEDNNLNAVRFLFMSHLSASKGLFVALEAIRVANETLRERGAKWRAHLTLAGSFASLDERTIVLDAIDEANRASADEIPCVELVGFLDMNQKRSVMEAVDFLIFPTFYEGETQGLVLLEAMSAGLPIITTFWRGVPEALPQGYPLIVQPRSTEELAAAIKEAPNCDWANLLRKHYEQNFTLEVFQQRMAEALL
jgi:glycosyltransferase involved in cell wall biosynthesis